jgi:gluconate 2-dehydrogenase gamma chain
MGMQTVDRREALRRLAIGGAAAATLPAWVETLSAFAVDHAHVHGQRSARAAAAWKPKILTGPQNETVISLSELIIPQTDTPGAKAAKVNEFIDGVLAAAPPAERDKFLAGLRWVDARAQREFTKPFAAATPEQQTALLTELSERSAKMPATDVAADKARAEKPSTDKAGSEKTGVDEVDPDKIGTDFFVAIKSMTIIGFYTSQVGLRDELGDDGTLFFAEFKGCTHPEHQG